MKECGDMPGIKGLLVIYVERSLSKTGRTGKGIAHISKARK